MNALEVLAGLDWWTVAGWTMLRYLWLGAVVGAAAGISGILLRRAGANVRYATAVAWLCVLAVLPICVAVWEGAKPQAINVADVPLIEIVPEMIQSAPGSAGGIVELARPNGPIETAPTMRTESVTLPNAGANPRQSRGLTAGLEWNPSIEIAAVYLPWVWIVGAPLTFLLLATGVVGAERLRRASDTIKYGPIADTCARLRASIEIRRQVGVALCERITTPVLVGIVRPIILLPPAALMGWSPDEIEMVLLHELAHVRRWDNLVNLVQRLVEAILFYQPAVWLVSNWVRREREACCDAVVVGRTQQPHAYAELLVALAAQLPRSVLFHPAASSAMTAGPIRGRIRRVLGIHDDPMLVSGKSLGVVMAGLLLAATLAVLNLPAQSEAEQKTGFTTEGTESTEEKTEVRFVVGASRFADGDSITITKVRGTSKTFEPGGVYWIEGKYTLGSRERASLSAFTTARNSGEGTGPVQKIQTTIVERGSGEFTLTLPVAYEGWPHVSFYPAEGGEGFGGVYFGTGASVLEKWWNEEDRTTEGTEDTEEKSGRLESPPGVGFTIFHGVPFEVGASQFADGDAIEITAIKGTSKKLESGNIYQVHGTYTLASRDRATLGANVTARNAAEGRSSGEKNQSMVVERGSGTFTLEMPMKVRGWPHVSFYPAEGGQSFGGVYFGTGDSVLEKWWNEKDRTTEGTEDTEAKRAEKKSPVAGLEESLEKRISFCVVLFNAPGRSRDLQELYQQFSQQGRTIYLYGYSVEPESAAGKRFRLTAEPTCVVFKHGQETARLEGIESKEQLVRFVESASADNNSVGDLLRDKDRIRSLFVPGPDNPVQTYGWDIKPNSPPQFDSLVELLEAEPRNQKIRFSYRVSDGGSRLQTDAPKAAQESLIKAIVQLSREAKLPLARPNRFPTLEEQKLADAIWKRAGLELEPIGAEDLQRVKALGYEGGVRVAGIAGNPGGILPDDILVGLHVWPTGSFDDVAAVLNRDDLSELNPLKYYVVRPRQTSSGGFGSGRPEVDSVVTGRMSVRLPDKQAEPVRPSDRYGAPTAVTAPSSAAEPDRQPAVVPHAAWPSPYSNKSSTAPSRAKDSPQEAALLREQVEFLQSEFDRIEALHRAGKQGGSSDSYELAAYELHLAKGELAIAEGDGEQALAQFREASEHADKALKAVEAAYRAGRVSYDLLLRSAENRFDIKRRILSLQKDVGQSNKADSSSVRWPSQRSNDRPHVVEGTAMAIPPGSMKSSANDAPTDEQLDQALADDPNVEMMQQELMSLQYQLNEQQSKMKSGRSKESDRLKDLIKDKLEKIAAYRTQAQENLVDNTKPNLRYDGKTFDDWRTVWQIELSAERRLEAIKALAAFAANGYGPETADAILQVAPNYDFVNLDGTFEGQLQSAIADTLSQKIPMKDWLPAFRQLCESDRLQDALILRVVALASTRDVSTLDSWRELLLGFTTDPRYENQDYILLRALVKTDPNLENATIRELIRENLLGDRKHVARAVQALRAADVLPPELTDVLLHAEEPKRQAARAALDRISGSGPTVALVKVMIDVLRDAQRSEEHLAAIRTLSAIGSAASDGEAQALLKTVLKSGDQAQQVAAACALARISNGSMQAYNLLQSALRDEYGKPHTDIQPLIEAEQRATLGRN